MTGFYAKLVLLYFAAKKQYDGLFLYLISGLNVKHHIFCLIMLTFPALSAYAEDEGNKLFVLGEGYVAYPFGRVVLNAFSNFELSSEVRSDDGSVGRNDSAKKLIGQPLYVYHDGLFIEKTRIMNVYIDPQDGCVVEGDHLQFESNSKLESMKYGVVTTAPLKGRHPLSRRRPKKYEIEAAHKLVAKLLAAKKINTQHILNLQKNLIITPMNFRDGRDYSLVIEGQYRYESIIEDAQKNSSIDTNQLRIITLFLIAELERPNVYKLKYKQVYVGDEGQMADMGSNLIDHLDLDADGVDEVLIQYNGYEWWGYSILKRNSKRWVRVHQQFGGGC